MLTSLFDALCAFVDADQKILAISEKKDEMEITSPPSNATTSSRIADEAGVNTLDFCQSYETIYVRK